MSQALLATSVSSLLGLTRSVRLSGSWAPPVVVVDLTCPAARCPLTWLMITAHPPSSACTRIGLQATNATATMAVAFVVVLLRWRSAIVGAGERTGQPDGLDLDQRSPSSSSRGSSAGSSRLASSTSQAAAPKASAAAADASVSLVVNVRFIL